MKKLITASLFVLAIAGTSTPADAFSFTGFLKSAKETVTKVAQKAGPVLDKVAKHVSDPKTQAMIGSKLAGGLQMLSSMSGKIGGMGAMEVE